MSAPNALGDDRRTEAETARNGQQCEFAVDTHDCFTASEYMAIDHFGLTEPGQSWRAIEAGDLEIGGRMPMNPSGGLLGGGHPVGATGVRMLLDCHRQVRSPAVRATTRSRALAVRPRSISAEARRRPSASSSAEAGAAAPRR